MYQGRSAEAANAGLSAANMAACDECWSRAYVVAHRTGEAQADVYRALVAANPEHPETEGPYAYDPLTDYERSLLRGERTT